MAASPSRTSSVADQLAYGAKYGPSSGAAIQRSQYLADALEQLQASGTNNIRTPTAMWANILSNAVLAYGKGKADKDALAAVTADRANADKALLAGTPIDPDAGPGAVTPPSLQDPRPDVPGRGVPIKPEDPNPNFQIGPNSHEPRQPIDGPVPGTPEAEDAQSATPISSAPPPAPSQVTNQRGPVQPASAPGTQAGPTPDQLALARMVAGEAGGESAEGQNAAASVAINRSKRYGKSLADIVAAPHQFEGYNSPVARRQTPQQLAAILANIQPALNGRDPTNGAMNFLNPDLQSQLGRPQPAWAPPGQGQRIGRHVFFGGSPGQQAAQGPQAPLQGNPQADQIPSGPTPVPPQPPQTAQGAPGVGLPGADGQQWPVAMQNGAPSYVPASTAPSGGVGPPSQPPPRQVVTPEEWQLAAGLLRDPRTHDQGAAELLRLKMRAASMPEDPSKPYWGADGRAHYAPGTEFSAPQQLSPSALVQTGPNGKVEVQSIPGVQGSVPEGMVRDPKAGGYSRVPTQQAQTFKIPGANGLFIMGADGKPQKVADDQYGPEQLLRLRQELITSEPVRLYQQSMDAYGAMLAAAKQGPGGMRAYALRDTFARAINPGAVARSGTIEAIKDAQGLPANVKSFFMNLQGDGDVPPDIAQQILDVTHGFVASHYSGAQHLVQSNADYAKRHQIDPADITIPLEEPKRFNIPRVGGGVSREEVIAQARAAITAGKPREAVIGRVKSMGLDPRGL